MRKRVERGPHGDRGRVARRRPSASRRSRACWAARRSRDAARRTPARWSSRAKSADEYLQARTVRIEQSHEKALLHRDVRLPDERQRLREGRGPAAGRRLRAGGRAPTTPTSSSSTPAPCARRPRRSSSTRWAASSSSSARGPSCVIGVGGCVAQLAGHARSSSARPRSTCSWARTTSRACPSSCAGARRRAAAAVDLDRKADTLHGPDRRGRALEPRARLRHRDGRLQPRLQLLRGAADARARGLPRRRRDRGRGRDRWCARGYPRGHAARPDRERVPPRRRRLRRAARAGGRGRRASQRLRFTTSHPEHVDARAWRTRSRDLPTALPVPPPAGAVGLRPHPRRRCAAATRAASTCETVALLREPRPRPRPVQRRHRRLPGRDRGRTSRPPSTWSRTVGFDGLFVFMYSPRPGHDGRAARRRRARGREAAAAAGAERARSSGVQARAEPRPGRDAASRCWWTRSTRAGRRLRPDAATSASSTSTAPATCSAGWSTVEITGSGPNSLVGTPLGKQFIDSGFRGPYILTAEGAPEAACRSR